jgi:hypothetical protein
MVGGRLRAQAADTDLSVYSMTPFATGEGYKSSPAWAPNGKDLTGEATEPAEPNRAPPHLT